MLEVLQEQGKSAEKRKKTYMCRLCGEYGIKLRKAHLVNKHGASKDRMSKRSTKNLLYEIFGAPCN